MCHNESDPDHPTAADTDISPLPPEPSSDRLDPEEFHRRFPFVWGDLSDEEIAFRIEHYQLPVSDDLGEGLERVLQQADPCPSAAESLYQPVVAMLRNLLRDECERNGRSSVFELVDALIELLGDSVPRGSTFGQQRLALLHRHPYAWSNVRNLAAETIKDGRDAQQLIEGIDYLRTLKEIGAIGERVRKVLPKTLPERNKLPTVEKQRRADALLQEFPELSRLLPSGSTRPGWFNRLTPDLAIRTIWGRRQNPAISEKTVSDRLRKARGEHLFRTKMSAFFEKYPRELQTEPSKKSNNSD